MRHVKFLDLAAQHAAIRTELNAAIDDVLTHSSFIGGKWVQKFEQSWAQYVGARHCIGVANGTDAIEIALRAVDVSLRRVAIPAFTAPPTAEAVVSAGACPVFCDCGSDFLINEVGLAQGAMPRLKAVVPVHLYGNACDMEMVQRLATDLGAVIVEDCCQAHGTRYKGQHVGTFGVAGAFSFYPSKNLGAMGDAGAIVTNDDQIAEFCRIYANGGRKDKNLHTMVGRNSRLDGLQAAILYVKLQHLDEWINHRKEVSQMYWWYLGWHEPLSFIALPNSSLNARHSCHIFAIRAQRRDALRAFLTERGVETMVQYPLAIPDQPAYQHYFTDGQLYARTLADTTLSLPIGPHVTEDDVKYISQCIQEFYNA